jgi:hypothetical protein
MYAVIRRNPGLFLLDTVIIDFGRTIKVAEAVKSAIVR